MEILKGFSFDLQRFADVPNGPYTATSTFVLADIDTDADTWVWKDNNDAAILTLTRTNATTYSLMPGAPNAVTTGTIDFSQLGSNITVTLSASTNNTIAATATYKTSTGTFTVANGVTANPNGLAVRGGAVTALTTNPLTIATGYVSMGANLGVTLGANADGVVYTGTTALTTAGAVVALSGGGGTVSLGAATHASNITVDKNGNVTNMDPGTVEYDAATTADGKTVKTASAGNFTLGLNGAGNNTTYTVSGDNSVTFTMNASGAGAAKISDIASGARVSFTTDITAPGNMPLQVGETTWLRETAGGQAVTIVSGGDAVANVIAGAGAIFTYGGTSDTATTGTYNFNGKTLTVDNDTDGVRVSTNTTSIATIAGVSAGSTVKTSALNVNVSADNIGTALGQMDRGSSFTLNDTTFTQGSIAGVITAGTDNIILNIGASGTIRVTHGTVYVSEGSTSPVYLNYNAGAVDATITPVNGDIAIRVNAAGFNVDDLDNGDSFTVKIGTSTKTYEVVNGVLWNTSDNTTFLAATLNSSDAGNQALNATFGTTAVATGVAVNVTDYNSAGTAFDPVDYIEGGAAAATVQRTDLLTAAVPVAAVQVNQFGNGSYVHSSGVIDSKTRSDALGALTYDGSTGVASYTATSDAKAETIVLTGSNAVWSVTGSSAADDITSNGLGSSLNGGAGNDTIRALGTDIAFGGEGNDSLVGAGTGSIAGGAGKDTLEGTAADVTLTGGDGADVFVLNHGAITDYNFSEDIVYTNLTMTNAVANATFTSAGVVSVKGGTQSVTLGAANEYAVKFKTSDNKTQVMGWAGENSANLDGSSISEALIIAGTTNEVADSLIGGSKNDTLYAGAGDSVFGGAGSNQISLAGATSAETVFFTGAGKDTVKGFNASFDEEKGDKLIIDGVSSLTTTLGTSDLTIKSGTSNMVLNGVANSGVAKVRVGNDKAIFASDTATVKLETLSDANYYYGTKGTTSSSKLDLSAVEESANIDLNNTAVIRNFTSIKGGAGNTTLVGTSANETLASGSGNTSLYGGAGKDVLQGATKVKDSFFMFNGGGNDTVTGFEGYTEDTAETADTVIMEELTSAKLISGGVQLAGKDSDKLFISGANANTEIQFSVGGNAGIAKIGSVSGANSFTYDKAVTYYGGGNAVDTLTFNSSDSDNHEVWLGDSSKGVTYASIDVINASNAGGDVVLAGDSAKQTITGGKGNSSLWGGTGNTADSLKGGAGTNVFFYGSGEGNDTISSANAEDTVNLYNISLSDVQSGEVTNAGVSVEFNDGSKLTVATSKDIKFSLASGESYIANHSTKGWDQA